MTNTYKLGHRVLKRSRYIIPAVLIVVVLAAAGSVAWTRLLSGPYNRTSVVDSLLDRANCAAEDEKVCRFLDSWKVQNSYSVTSKVKREGVVSVSTYAANGTKTKVTDGQTSGSVIVVGSTRYTQDSSGTWWKQPVDNSTAPTVSQALPSKDGSAEVSGPLDSRYKYLKTEACGDLTCYKYQVIDADPGARQYIWFDTESFQLRRTQTVAADGTVTDSTIVYEQVAIEAPAQAQEGAPSVEPQPATDAAAPEASGPAPEQ